VLALLPVALILFFVLRQGVSALGIAFFTQMPKPVASRGGMANAIVVPSSCSAWLRPRRAIGISRIYLSEFRASRLASAVRFSATC